MIDKQHYNVLSKITLAKNLVFARHAAGITQGDLASKAGVSRATIAQIESGEGDPKISTVTDIAYALETSPVLLLLGSVELEAIVEVARDKNISMLTERFPQDQLDQIKRLLQSNMQKSQLRAAEMGVKAAQEAGLVGLMGTAALGAFIGTSLLPGVGTIVGGILGGVFSRTFFQDNKKK